MIFGLSKTAYLRYVIAIHCFFIAIMYLAQGSIFFLLFWLVIVGFWTYSAYTDKE